MLSPEQTLRGMWLLGLGLSFSAELLSLVLPLTLTLPPLLPNPNRDVLHAQSCTVFRLLATLYFCFYNSEKDQQSLLMLSGSLWMCLFL